MATGTSLASWLAHAGRSDIERRRELMARGRVIEYLHRGGVVNHLSSAAVFVTPADKGASVDQTRVPDGARLQRRLKPGCKRPAQPAGHRDREAHLGTIDDPSRQQPRRRGAQDDFGSFAMGFD